MKKLTPHFAVLCILIVMAAGCGSLHPTRNPPPSEAGTHLADHTTWLSAPAAIERVEAANDGMILVFVSGDASRGGQHWITQDASILTVEEVSGAGNMGASTKEPRFVVIHRMVDGHLLELRYDLKRRTKTEKEGIHVQHGDAIIFPWTNCW